VEHCDGVVAGNRYLADHYERQGARVWLVPTSVDTDVWTPRDKTENDRWTIGWSGSWTNLKFLQQIEKPLAEFLAQNLDSRLLIVSDRRPQLNQLPRDSWLFVEWSPQNEVGLVQLMDVGLMPLEDSEWALGKCGFKMLSYMAAGLPVVVTPVGVNAEILGHAEIGLAATKPNDWFQAFEKLYSDQNLGTRLGINGRRVVEERYSVRTNVIKLAEIFQEVASE
jgi:glycosyltransferase involved in cell wall biosynthesis